MTEEELAALGVLIARVVALAEDGKWDEVVQVASEAPDVLMLVTGLTGALLAMMRTLVDLGAPSVDDLLVRAVGHFGADG